MGDSHFYFLENVPFIHKLYSVKTKLISLLRRRYLGVIEVGGLARLPAPEAVQVRALHVLAAGLHGVALGARPANRFMYLYIMCISKYLYVFRTYENVNVMTMFIVPWLGRKSIDLILETQSEVNRITTK